MQTLPRGMTGLVLGLAAMGAGAAPQCEPQAIEQAAKLLRFHSGGDSRAEVMPQARRLAPITNPVDKHQKLEVFEVPGYIYKASYRLRLIYFPIGKDCVLMGQEVLELSRP